VLIAWRNALSEPTKTETETEQGEGGAGRNPCLKVRYKNVMLNEAKALPRN
jgi:hypothetical protein